MATLDPSAAAEKLAINVAGGQTIKSAFPLSALAPAMILASSPREATRPFIFQLPATSGMMLAAIENPLAVRLSDRERLCQRGGHRTNPLAVARSWLGPYGA